MIFLILLVTSRADNMLEILLVIQCEGGAL